MSVRAGTLTESTLSLALHAPAAESSVMAVLRAVGGKKSLQTRAKMVTAMALRTIMRMLLLVATTTDAYGHYDDHSLG